MTSETFKDVFCSLGLFYCYIFLLLFKFDFFSLLISSKEDVKFTGIVLIFPTVIYSLALLYSQALTWELVKMQIIRVLLQTY